MDLRELRRARSRLVAALSVAQPNRVNDIRKRIRKVDRLIASKSPQGDQLLTALIPFAPIEVAAKESKPKKETHTEHHHHRHKHKPSENSSFTDCFSIILRFSVL